MTSTHDGQQPIDPRPELRLASNQPAAQAAPAVEQPSPASPDVDSRRARREGKRTEARRERDLKKHQRVVERAVRRRKLDPRTAVRLLVGEHKLHGTTRSPDTTTHGETLIHAIGKSGAEAVLDGTTRNVSNLADRRDGLQAKQDELRIRADARPDDLIGHPDGGVRTVAQTQADQDAQRVEIFQHEDEGSRKHTRLPRLLRLVPWVVLAADSGLYLYFISGVTNVDWSHPLSAALVFALMLTIAVTVLSFGYLTFVGEMLNHYKTDDGTVATDDLDPITKCVVVLAGIGMTVLAVLMFVRMRTEVIQALGPGHGGTALMIALAVAVVSILANTMVIVVHALDGSVDTRRLDALGNAIRRPLTHAHRLREKADRLEPKRWGLTRRAARVAAAGRTRAGRQLAIANRSVDAARCIHQGAELLSRPTADANTVAGVIGYRTPIDPTADERALNLALSHVSDTAPTRPDSGSNDDSSIADPEGPDTDIRKAA